MDVQGNTQGLNPVKKATWKDFIIVTKPRLVSSNVITTFVGLWLAFHSSHANPLLTRSEEVLLAIAILVGTTLIMLGSCALNNFLDRDLDIQMNRTKNRPSADGTISPKVLLWYGTAICITGLLFLLYANVLAAFLGLVGIFVYVIVYTKWLKRTSTLNTIVGGISGAVPPIVGWAGVTGGLEMGAWILFLILFFWQPPHFLALAMYRSEEYHAAGYKMLPGVSGFAVTKRQMLVWTAALVPTSLLLHSTGTVGFTYWIIALVLGIAWLALLIKGFFTNDDIKWAKQNFKFSLVYLTVISLVMVFNAV